MSRHRLRRSSVFSALALSVSVHLLVVLFLSVRETPVDPKPQARREVVVAPLLSDRELKRARSKRAQARAQTKPPPKPRKPPPKPQDLKNKQVVDIPPPKVRERPTKSRFLAEYNSKVKEEMLHRSRDLPQRAMLKSERRSNTAGDDIRGSRRGKRGARVQPRTPQRVTPQDTQQSRRQPRGAQSKERQRERQRQVRPPKKAKPKRSTKLVEGEGAFAPSRREEDTPPKPTPAGVSNGGSQQKTFTSLAPTHLRSLLPTLGPKTLAAKHGSIDHIKDMKRGDKTALNAQEYRHASFFNRVKRAVRVRWTPQEAIRRIDPNGNVLGVADRDTVLAITLNPSGAIVSAYVLKTSGVHSLDQSALRAFAEAQPFHNPPRELIGEDGLIRFKFSFHLEFNTRGLNLFR